MEITQVYCFIAYRQKLRGIRERLIQISVHQCRDPTHWRGCKPPQHFISDPRSLKEKTQADTRGGELLRSPTRPPSGPQSFLESDEAVTPRATNYSVARGARGEVSLRSRDDEWMSRALLPQPCLPPQRIN